MPQPQTTENIHVGENIPVGGSQPFLSSSASFPAPFS
jgi:hypothetical protein